jgi:hypothetical protein
MGTSDEESDGVLSIAMAVGGSITIPHVRRASRLWEEMREK